MKAIAISNLGYINEAYQLLIKVARLKDLPTHIQRNSEYLKINQGCNWFADRSETFLCNYAPGYKSNKLVIE